ncbi:hypothetical protein PhiM1_19 [Pectobacterium phage PhiM1]|uniref:Uncharacterized protein n=1 Tax=Pectobacterium phage PhiM1 TaxID=1211386 RepID=A0A1P7WFZ1_9CAUD|nr:HNH endonuclease [Pectobacterium phage PhiM1]AFQ22504.1 hypothetical protein PhiM1_19 [Pectobacterium phage PhiM1]
MVNKPVWVVLGEAGRTPRGLKLVYVQCTCGTERVITEDSYKRGKSTSCGCWRTPTKQSRIRDGKPSRTYISWQSMRTRCLNPNSSDYASYGGRGITVCTRWASFKTFLEDMGERPERRTLDRVDVNGNYEPANCRWATAVEQRNNQRPRNTSNVQTSNMGC